MLTTSQSVTKIFFLIGISSLSCQAGNEFDSSRNCAELHSSETGLQGQALSIGNGKVLGNIAGEYATATQNWNSSSGYWNVSSGCELTACQNLYLGGGCSTFGGNNIIKTNSNRWLSASCTCNKECKCSDISLKRNICARAYLHPGGCSTCDAQYLELEETNPSFPNGLEDKITSFLIRPGCAIEVYEQEDYEGDSEYIQDQFIQNWKGKIGSFECQCVVEDEDGGFLDDLLENSEEDQPLQLDIPDSLDEIVSQLQHYNYNHPGLLAAFSSLTHGRSPKNGYMLLIGSSGAGKSSTINLLLNNPNVTLAGDSESTTSDILEFRIPIPVDELGASNSELRVIDTPGLGDTRGLQHDAVFLATLDDYLSGHDELKDRIPHLVLVFHHFTDNRFDGQGAKFVSMIQGLDNFRTKITDETYSNVLFVFTHFCSETSQSILSNPAPKLLRFKEVIEEYSLFPKPILTTVTETQPNSNELLMVNDDYVLPNKELFPSNLLERIETITMKGNDKMGRAIINRAFRTRKTHKIEGVSVFKMVSPSHPKVAKYLSSLTSSILNFASTEVSQQLATAYENLPPSLKSRFNTIDLERLQKKLNVMSIRSMNDLPKTTGAILDLLEEMENTDVVLYLLEKGLYLKTPIFPKSIVAGSGFSSIKDSVLPITPYKLDVLKTSRIGYKIPESIKCEQESQNFNLLTIFDTQNQYVRSRLESFGINMGTGSNDEVFTGLHDKINEGFYVKDTSCYINVCSFVASRFFKLFQLNLEENSVLNPDFISRVTNLSSFSESNYQNVELWKQFFNDYGTHVVKSTWGGGRVDIHVSMAPSTLSVASIRNKLFQTVEFAENLTTLISEHKVDREQLLPTEVTYSLVFNGGSHSYHTSDLTSLNLEDDSKMMKNWKKSLKLNPIVIPAQFISIDRVAQALGTEKSKYIRDAALRLYNSTLSYASPTLTPIPDPRNLLQEMIRQQRETQIRLMELTAEKRRLEAQAKKESLAELLAKGQREQERKRLEVQRKREELQLKLKLEHENRKLLRQQKLENRRADAEKNRLQRQHQRLMANINRQAWHRPEPWQGPRQGAAAMRKAERESRRKLRQELRHQRQQFRLERRLQRQQSRG